jgi:hypothetical protein
MAISVQASYSISPSSQASYTKVAIAMHLLIALLIFLNVSLGI